MLSPVKFELAKIVEWNEWKHTCIPRLKHAAKLEIRHLPQLDPHDGRAVIVGAGPSVVDYLPDLRTVQADGITMLFTVNAVHDWAVRNDIIPNAHVVFEPDIDDVRDSLGGDPHPNVTYYIASHCDPKVFKQLSGSPQVLFHPYCFPQGYQNAIARYFKGEFMVAGGYCTFFRSLTIAIILGFRNFDLYGVDSSFEDTSHMRGYKLANIEERVDVWGKNPYTEEMRKFTTQGGLAYQAVEFIEFCKINQSGLKLRIHGDGLLRYLHEAHYPEQYQ